MLGIIFAALAGLAWSVASFTSGRASRTMSAPLLTSAFNFAGVILFGTLFLLSDEPTNLTTDLIVNAALTGVIGGLGFSLGLVCIARGFSRGRAGVISPLIAVVSIVLPLIFVSIFRERPSTTALVGILTLLVVPLLASRSRARAAAHVTRSVSGDVTFGVASGAGFGLYFIALILAPESAQLLMLAFLQFASMVTMLIAHLVSKASFKIGPHAKKYFFAFIVFELMGVVFLRLAFNVGPPASVSAISGTLDPIGILILSAVFNKEIFTKPQIVGFGILIVGITLTAIGS